MRQGVLQGRFEWAGQRLAPACVCMLALAAVAASGTSQQGCPGPLADAEVTLDAWRAEAGVPSLVVVVARRSGVVFEYAGGWADAEKKVAATPSVSYSLASISKPITATAVMRLVEQGHLDLDAPVNAWLADSPLVDRTQSGIEPTVRHLLTHTAGLPLHHHFLDPSTRPIPPPKPETLGAYGFLVAPPGTRYQYSNLGYGILEHLIERQLHRSFDAFLQDEVFGPLGMTGASVGPPDDRPVAIRYGRDGRPLSFYDVDHRGGSAIFASAHDLVRFGLAHLGHAGDGRRLALSRRARQRMQQPSAGTAPGLAQGYGLGWQIESRRGQTLVSHGGGMPGVSTQLTLVPESGLVIVALTNASSPLPQRIADEFIARLQPPPGSASMRPASASFGGSVAAPKRVAELLGEWEGRVHVDGSDRRVALHVPLAGPAAICLDGAPATRVHGQADWSREVTGLVLDRLESPDTAGIPHRVYVKLDLRGDVLAGSISAIARDGLHPGFALSHWAELRRVPTGETAACAMSLPAPAADTPQR